MLSIGQIMNGFTIKSIISVTRGGEVKVRKGQSCAVLVVEHKHGTNVSVLPDEEAAKRQLVAYVNEFWPSDKGEKPTDEDELIAEYFHESDEFYTLTNAKVEA